MLFPLFSPPLAPWQDYCATSAEIKCILAYTQDLENCQIDVEISGGIVILTGRATCAAAVRMAIEIAADFTSKPVRSAVQVAAIPARGLNQISPALLYSERNSPLQKVNTMKKTLILAMATTLSLVSVASAANTHTGDRKRQHNQQVASQPKERLGMLSCEVAGGIGLLIASSKAVTCQFKQRTGKVERYTGTIGKLGLDVGITGKSYLSWVVVNTAPTTIGKGSLAGTYVGASASASVGVGLGANALVGGNAKNFGLQPLSAEAGTGLNVAAGVSRLQLRPAS